MCLEDEHCFVVGFLSAVLLSFILLMFPIDMSISFRVGWFCFSYSYVVLPLAVLTTYMLWRRGRKMLSTMVAAVATGLTLYGLILYILYLAFISEY